MRRTDRIALVVGVVLTSIDQLNVFIAGHTDAFTFLMCAINFIVPFVVSTSGYSAAAPEIGRTHRPLLNAGDASGQIKGLRHVQASSVLVVGPIEGLVAPRAARVWPERVRTH